VRQGKSYEPTTDGNRDVWDEIYNAALIVNPAFNVYHIFDMLPTPSNMMGFPESSQNPAYFNRPDVKAAIHAPVDVHWAVCTDKEVFPNGDASLPSAFSVLPNVIEKSERSLVVHGLVDFRLIADGTCAVSRT